MVLIFGRGVLWPYNGSGVAPGKGMCDVLDLVPGKECVTCRDFAFLSWHKAMCDMV